MMPLTLSASLSEQVSYDRAESGWDNWIQLKVCVRLCVQPARCCIQNTHQFLFAQPLRPLSPVVEEVAAKAGVTLGEAVQEVAIVVAEVQQPSLFVLIDWLVVVILTQVTFLESFKFNLISTHSDAEIPV